LESRSKIPPQLGELLGMSPELSRALAFSHVPLRYDTSRAALTADGSRGRLSSYSKIAALDGLM
jgi:hypothetical protein